MDLKRPASRPWSVFAIYTVLSGALYLLAVREPWRIPLVIEPSALDHRIPLVPAAAWIYATYFLTLPVLILSGSRRPGFRAVFFAAMGCGLANTLFYNLVPSRILERAAAPPGTLLALIQRLDTSLGAIPSGHAALPAAVAMASLIASLGVEKSWRRISALYSVWTLLIAASTLMTKQHYFFDAAAGLLYGAAAGAGGMGAARILRNAHAPTVHAFLRDWFIILAAIGISLAWRSVPVCAVAALIIASRQHALLVLYHDGVHGLAARGTRANDFIVNSFAGVPFLLPLHMYRALHQSHHQKLGRPEDPERVLLYRGQPWEYRPLASRSLALQLAGDATSWNGVIMVFRYFRELRPGGALRLPKTRWFPELPAQFILYVAALAVAARFHPSATAHVLLLWYAPYVTLTQLLQKIRSFAEHAAPTSVSAASASAASEAVATSAASETPSAFSTAATHAEAGLSCSWSPGILGRLTIWPYNINYHREHHARADVPWDLLPAAFPDAVQRPGRELVHHLWKGERA